MKTNFELVRASSVQHAVEMKAKHGARAKFWAGGTDMMLLWENELIDFDVAIDLTAISELRHITKTDDGIRIGAMTTLDDLEQSDAHEHNTLKVLGETARLMCTKQTRTIATLGGNLCHAAPSADLLPPVIALDAEAEIASVDGTRTDPLSGFFTGVKETALADNELLTAVNFPNSAGRRAASYVRVARTVVDIALVAASASISVNSDNKVSAARVVLGAAAPTPIRVPSAEQALQDASIDGLSVNALDEAGRLAAEESRPISDIRTSEAYRREMCRVLTRRAVSDCVQQLGGIIA